MKIKKWIISIASVLLFFSLQTAAFRVFPIGRSVPELLLIITVSYGLMRGEHDGILTGFLCGLLFDVFFMDILGFYALLYAFIGFVCGAANDLFRKDDIKLPLISILLSEIFFCLCRFFFLNVLLGNFNFRFFARDVLLPETAFTMLVSIGAYPLLLIVEERIVNRQFIKKKEEGEGITDAL